FAPHHVAKETDKVLLFENGLQDEIRKRVSLFEAKTLSELVTKALIVEKTLDTTSGGKEQLSKRPRDFCGQVTTNGVTTPTRRP
ncbi:unnamed protein product, partial [Ilex paraguariensis]